MARRRPRREGRSLKPAEARGFAGAVISCIALCIYFLWAGVPERVLNSWGVTYYPSKEWAVTVPAYIMITIALGLGVYSGLDHMLVKPPGSYSAIADKHSVYLEEPRNPGAHPLRIPDISDLPITLVNDILFPCAEHD